MTVLHDYQSLAVWPSRLTVRSTRRVDERSSLRGGIRAGGNGVPTAYKFTGSTLVSLHAGCG